MFARFPSTLLLTLLLVSSGAVSQEAGGEGQVTPPGYVFGVTVSNARELDIILDRAANLLDEFDPQQHGRIAIVLHGEELQLFQKQNYAANQSLVEKARLLDSEQVIDIKACQTMMRQLHIEQSELPPFIEQVPLAPVEIDRLVREKGFTLF